MKILLITSKNIWSLGYKSGNQSLYNTIMGYAKHGHKVFVLKSQRHRYDDLDLHENIMFIKFKLIPDFVRKSYRFLLDRININSLFKKDKKLKESSNFQIPDSNRMFVISVIDKISYLFHFIRTLQVGNRIIKHECIDLIYGYEVAGIPSAYILGKIYKLPIVARFQGTILYPFMNSFWKKFILWNHFLSLKLPADLKIMTNDGTQGDKVLRKLGTPREKILFLMNGIDKRKTELDDDLKNKLLSELGIEDCNTKIVISVSRLAGWKRVDRLIKSANEISKYEIPFPYKFVIVGDGPERNSLQNMVRYFGIENRVIFTGKVPNDKVRQYLALAEVFVSFYDLSNLGNPLLESLVEGKPIITINNGDTGEIIKHDYNGILLSEANLDEDIPRSILSLLMDDDRRKKLSENARNFAEKELLTWDERMKLEIEKVEKLIAQKKHNFRASKIPEI